MSLTLNEYQEKAFATNKGTRVFVARKSIPLRRPDSGNYVFDGVDISVVEEIPGLYNAIGLSGEVGEYMEKLKKRLRDGVWSPTEAAKELGDTLWYLSQEAMDIGFTLEEIAEMNLAKLADRRARGVIQGSGDNR